MKFASSYEPNQYEADIYGAWEAAGVFDPKITTKPVDDDGDGIDDREESGELANSISGQSADPSSQNDNGHGRESDTEISGRDRLTRCDFDDCGPRTLQKTFPTPQTLYFQPPHKS